MKPNKPGFGAIDSKPNPVQTPAASPLVTKTEVPYHKQKKRWEGGLNEVLTTQYRGAKSLTEAMQIELTRKRIKKDEGK